MAPPRNWQLIPLPYFLAMWYDFLISSQTASVTSTVFALPPRSAVTMPRSHTRSTTSNSFVLASSSPSQANISALVQKVATGLATPFPVISNADPCIGSNILGFFRVGSKLEVGAMPIDPANAAARSDRMSACWTVSAGVPDVSTKCSKNQKLNSPSSWQRLCQATRASVPSGTSSHQPTSCRP